MSKLTEQEIELNLSLIRLISPKIWDEKFKYSLEDTNRINILLGVYNYTDSWKMLMPLVVEHDIHYSPPFEVKGDYYAARYDRENRDSVCETKNKDPQLALAECLLKVLEAKE